MKPADIVVFILAGLVCAIIGVELVVILVNLFSKPGYDQADALAALSDVTNTLIAAVVSFVAGRATVNGRHGSADPPP